MIFNPYYHNFTFYGDFMKFGKATTDFVNHANLSQTQVIDLVTVRFVLTVTHCNSVVSRCTCMR